MRLLFVLLNMWLFVGLFTLADEYHLSREMFGKWFIVLGLGFLSTLVHEGGHAFAAWRIGYKVRRIAVLPLEFDLAKRRFGWASVPRSDLAGYVSAVPRPNATRRDAIWFVIGGPLAEAMLGAILFALLAISTPSPSSARIAPEIERPSFEEEVAVARLPADLTVAEWVQSQRQAEVMRGLAAMLALFAIGSAGINLLPIGGSDGDHLLGLIRKPA